MGFRTRTRRCVTGAFQVDVGAVATFARPRAKLHRLEILMAEPADDWHALRIQELRVAVDALSVLSGCSTCVAIPSLLASCGGRASQRQSSHPQRLRGCIQEGPGDFLRVDASIAKRWV